VLQIQIGAAARTDYIYGLNRLSSLNGSTKIWYVADALGSVRRTMTDVGTPRKMNRRLTLLNHSL
jgi:hypothetical protein